MNHGYDDDEDYELPAPQRSGPSGLLAQLMGGHMGLGQFVRAPPPHAYDDYFKAYSVAVMGGKERPELLYGGKIIMPPSALAKLSALDIQSPWTFHLRNPRNPNVYQTHAGVLEFIADEGIVYLPAWMMKSLHLNEGDPVRLTGAKLPKGKLVKIQAQSVDFLEVSDAKAVLESALRFYSCLTKSDIIEITYNSLTFEFLIIETEPAGPGISVIDTDLEVDFAAPVGYVEPPRPAPAPIPTMAEKLKIDLGETTAASAGTSRSASVMSMRPGGSGEATPLESFTGVGQSLSGKRVKGKGLAKKIEEVDASSKINRNDGPRIITPASLNDQDRKVPAALVLPAGKFFFGYKYVPFDPSKAAKPVLDETQKAPSTFSGPGATLSGRRAAPAASSSASTANGNGASHTASTAGTTASDDQTDPWSRLGGGNTLSGRSLKREREEPSPAVSPSPVRSAAASASVTFSQPEIIDATMLDEDDFTFGEEYGDDDDNDVIEIDSD